MSAAVVVLVVASLVGGEALHPAASPAPSPPAAAASAFAIPSIDMETPRNQAVAVLAAGVGLSVVYGVALTTGLDAERELQAGQHDVADADALLNRRTIAGWVAWPAGFLAAAGIVAGVYLLNNSDAPAAAATAAHKVDPPAHVSEKDDDQGSEP